MDHTLKNSKFEKESIKKMTEPTTNPQIPAEGYQTPLPNAYNTSADKFVEEQNRFGGAGILSTSDNGDISQLPSQTSSTNHVSDAYFGINSGELTMCFITQIFFQDTITFRFELTSIPTEDYQTPPNASDTCNSFVSPQDFFPVDEQNHCSGENGPGKQNISNNRNGSRPQSQSSSSWSRLSPWSQLSSEYNVINHVSDAKFSINESSMCSIREVSVHCLQDAVEYEKVPRENTESRKQKVEDEPEDDFILLNRNSIDRME